MAGDGLPAPASEKMEYYQKVLCVCVCVWGGFGRRRKRSANACGGVKRERRKMSARVRDGLCPWSTTLVFEYQCSMLCLSLQKSTPLGNVHV